MHDGEPSEDAQADQDGSDRVREDPRGRVSENGADPAPHLNSAEVSQIGSTGLRLEFVVQRFDIAGKPFVIDLVKDAPVRHRPDTLP